MKNGDIIYEKMFHNIAIKLEAYFFHLYNTVDHIYIQDIDNMFLEETGVYINRKYNNDNLYIHGCFVIKDIDQLIAWTMGRE